MEDSRSTSLATTVRSGRMSGAAKQLRQRKFVQLLMDLEANLTQEEICRQCGISRATYTRWAADPEVLKLAGMDNSRLAAATRAYAFAHRGTALATLVDVMQRSRNDVARVRAAELMHQIGEQAAQEKDGDSGDAAAEVARLLSRRSPTFIVNNLQMIAAGAGSQPAGLLVETGDIIEGELVGPGERPETAVNRAANDS
jgi:hypothetical protein